jgi:hypothetical protein
MGSDPAATSIRAIQDQLPDQPCWGCGPNNPHGLRPVPIHSAVELSAHTTERTARKTRVECTVIAAGELCARAEVLAIRLGGKPDGLIAGLMHD